MASTSKSGRYAPYTLREGLPTAQKASAKTYKRLQPIAPGYSGVSRPRRALLVRRGGKTHLYPLTSSSPPGSPHLPGALGTSTMRVLAAPSWGVGLERSTTLLKPPATLSCPPAARGCRLTSSELQCKEQGLLPTVLEYSGVWRRQRVRLPCSGEAPYPPHPTPTRWGLLPLLLLLKDFAYSYRVWITLIKLLYSPLQYLKIDPDIHAAE